MVLRILCIVCVHTSLAKIGQVVMWRYVFKHASTVPMYSHLTVLFNSGSKEHGFSIAQSCINDDSVYNAYAHC